MPSRCKPSPSTGKERQPALSALERPCYSAGVNQDELIKVLKAAAPMNWPTIWPAIMKHREDCLSTVERTVQAMLDDPAMTRKWMRSELQAVLQALRERGPQPCSCCRHQATSAREPLAGRRPG